MKKNIYKIIMIFLVGVMMLINLHCFAATGVNIASGKNVIATAVDAKGYDKLNVQMPPENAVDSKSETSWKTLSNAIKGYMIIDLEVATEFNHVIVKQENIKRFDLDVSDDMSIWNKIKLNAGEDEIFGTLTARYLRVSIEEVDKSDVDYGFSISEVEVYKEDGINLPSPIIKENERGIFSDIKKGTELEKGAKLLTDLNAIQVGADNAFYPSSSIRRDEFAGIITSLYSADKILTGTVDYEDVAQSNPYYKAIVNMKEHGLMRGVGGEKFFPEQYIKSVDALKVVLCMLGYAPQIEMQGGHPVGSMVIGSKLGLKVGGSSNLSRGELATLLLKSFNLNIVEAYGITLDVTGDGTIYYDKSKEKTILNTINNIEKIRGTVTANQLTGVDNIASIAAAHSLIVSNDEESITVFAKDIDEIYYLGLNVEAYYYDNGVNSLVSIFQYKSDVSVILSDDIISSDQTMIKSNIDGKTKKSKFSATAPVIYNGVYLGRLAYALADNELCITSGKIELVDNDQNNVADVVKIFDFEDKIVMRAYEADCIISLYGGSNLKFEPQNKKQNIVKDGKKVEMNTLGQYACLSVMKSKAYAGGDPSAPVTIYVSENPLIQGNLSEKSEKNLTIDAQVIDLLPEIILNTSLIKQENLLDYVNIGSEIIVYRNMYGKIVGVKTVSTEYDYGYVITVGQQEGVESTIQMKLLDATGRICIYNLKKKITMNGIPNVDSKVILQRFGENQDIIRYVASHENVISEIVTVADQYGMYENDKSLIAQTDGYYKLKLVKNQKKFLAWTTGSKEFVYDANTVFFRVPSKYNADETKFEVTSISSYSDSEIDGMRAYNVTKMGLAKVIVQKVDSVLVGSAIDEYGRPHCLVTKVLQTLNADGEKVYKISYMRYGVKKTAVLDEDAYVLPYTRNATDPYTFMRDTSAQLPASSLAPGMIVVIDEAQSPIKTIHRKYPSNGLNGTTVPEVGGIFSYGWSYETIWGMAKAVEGSSIVIDGGNRDYYYSIPDIEIVKWNARTQKASKGTAADIMTAEAVGKEQASYIYFSPFQKTFYIYNF